jgi:hypothetical protein
MGLGGFFSNFRQFTGLLTIPDYNKNCGKYDGLRIKSLRAQRRLPREPFPAKERSMNGMAI